MWDFMKIIQPKISSRNCIRKKLKMHKKFLVQDASAKIPSGVFNGNLNQYGDYDMCLNIVAGTKEFQGKYLVKIFKQLLGHVRYFANYMATKMDCLSYF